VIAIIDYGLGNLASVQKALNFLSLSNVITDDHSVIRSSKAILLPGVGSFEQGMKNLAEKGLDKLLNTEVVEKKKKFLGICLGMQLVANWGTEPRRTNGLGWIDGQVEKITAPNLRVPHLGWNEVSFNEELSRDLTLEPTGNNYYFIHSYHFIPADPAHIVATAPYGHSIVAGVKKDNILAFQFHPEKSQAAGLSLLKNYFTEEHAEDPNHTHSHV